MYLDIALLPSWFEDNGLKKWPSKNASETDIRYVL